jgi:alanyl-tRNA synthetase
MGDTGPCGPCSEIFYDHGEHIPGGPPGSPGEDGDRFIEIWNLVFMQFEQMAGGERAELPKPSIDTGMGLERIAAVLQGSHDNYDTDLLRAIIEASAEVSGADPDGAHSVSHRVIADHLRASSFLIADGVLPSNEGRGYVLRRIMRRAMRHVHRLAVGEPMLWRLVPTLVREMGQHFGELQRAEALITETLKLEEARFNRTLDRGMKLLDEETAKLGESEALAGEVAFKLYDTYGFPLDLTQDILRGQGRGVDQAGFDAAMGRQRAAARRSWVGSGEAATETLWYELRERHGASEFLGYESETGEGQVQAIIVDGQVVESVEAAEAGASGGALQFLVNQTPFYGESGGQMGDSGIAFTAGGSEVRIDDTQKSLGDLHVHIGEVVKGRLAPGDAVELRVDGERRAGLRAHHSATHLLHEALRRRLGDHVTQKGSLVAPDRLRFDISHPAALSGEDVAVVEALVNDRIRENAATTTLYMTPDEAVEAGALALFGEKYGEEVRVVSMGGADEAKGRDEEGHALAFSTELCGGTHVRRTGDIGFFKIIGESALAAGVRRIEAVAGAAAVDFARRQDDVLGQAAAALKAAPADLAARVDALLDDRKRLERELTGLRHKMATGGGEGPEARDIGGVAFASRLLSDVPPRDLKPMADALKTRVGSGVVALVSVTEGKASLVVGVTDDLTGRVSAVDLVRAGSAAVGGTGGGGRPDMAQAGGPDGAAAEAALSAIEQRLAAL